MKKAKGAAHPAQVEEHRLLIYQLNITLAGIAPPIFRRVQVNDHPLAGLHEIIQVAMEWEDDHLHEFRVGKRRGGDHPHADRGSAQWARETCLRHLVANGVKEFLYVYDFGDNWVHAIEIEQVMTPEEGARYPRCIEGRRACPPEDSGGIGAYLDFLDRRSRGEEDDEEGFLAPGFDPEEFDLERTNRRLSALRRWLGVHQSIAGVRPQFGVKQLVRVRPGTPHPAYGDIPMGGWVGTVADVSLVTPVSYRVEWSAATLAQVHPVYFKRCERDEVKPGEDWVDEPHLEPAAEGEPVVEQPREIVTRPLSPDDWEDRVRAVFELTGDDPLPTTAEDRLQTYYEFLKSHVALPFETGVWRLETSQDRRVKVIEILPAEPSSEGIRCRAYDGEAESVIPLVDLNLDEGEEAPSPIDDYTQWYWECVPEEEEDDDWGSGEDDEPPDGAMPAAWIDEPQEEQSI